MRMLRSFFALALGVLTDCGGAVATEVTATDSGTPTTTHDAATDAGSQDRGVREPREVRVMPVPRTSLSELVFAHTPDSCGNGLPTCASGRCVVYEGLASSPGYVCVDGDVCAPLHCAVGRCGRGDDNLDNNYRCNPYASPCDHDRDCDAEHPYCVRGQQTGYDYSHCARDYASACTLAGCAGAACLVTESDPVAMRCAP